MSDLDGAAESAQACAEFMRALVKEGFDNQEAVRIVAAWMGRPGTDMAALNAVYENFAETLKAS